MPTKRAKSNSVKVVNRNGKLYLDFRYRSDRFRPALKLVASEQNTKVAQTIASRIELDIALGQFDSTLISYLGQPEEKRIPRDIKRSDLSAMFRYYWDERGLGSKDDEGVRRFIYRANPNAQNIIASINAQDWSVSTHNRYAKVLNRFFDYLEANCGIKIERLKPQKADKRVSDDRKPFTDDELNRILFTFSKAEYIANGTKQNFKSYFPLVLFLASTGCRLGEAAGLKWKHVDLDRGLITIEESLSPRSNYDSRRSQKSTKTGSVRTFPIPKELREGFLETAKRENKDAYVFLGPCGKPINQRNFTQRIWKKALSLAGVDYRVPYALRHTMASRAIEQGIPLTGIAYLMGHSDTTMVMKQYGHMINRPSLPELPITTNQ